MLGEYAVGGNYELLAESLYPRDFSRPTGYRVGLFGFAENNTGLGTRLVSTRLGCTHQPSAAIHCGSKLHLVDAINRGTCVTDGICGHIRHDEEFHISEG